MRMKTLNLFTGIFFILGIGLLLNSKLKITGLVIETYSPALKFSSFLGLFFILVFFIMFIHSYTLSKKIKGGLAALLLSGMLVAPLSVKYKNQHPRSYVGSGKYTTETLYGKKAGDLYSNYIGVNGMIPDTLEVDFKKQLDDMYSKKIKKSNNKVIENFYNNHVKNFNPKKTHKMSINRYISRAQNSMNNVNRNIDWNKVGELKDLDKERLDLLKQISNSLDGKDLISYSLTELMPSKDGPMNVDMMNFMLENAGTKYVELIPALGDKLASIGPYQFTSYAVYDTPNEKRGASIINQALPKKIQIPGSVTKLQGDDHHKAAYLFAINNLAYLIKDLNKEEVEVLSKKGINNMENIVKFIATSHHHPESGKKIAKKWLDNGGDSDFTDFCSGRFIEYSKKTDANYDEIHNPTKREIPKAVRDLELEGKFQDLDELNSKGYNVFKYFTKSGDNPSEISKRFNKMDKDLGDKFEETGYRNVVDSKGNPINKFKTHQEVYFIAKKKQPNNSKK